MKIVNEAEGGSCQRISEIFQAFSKLCGNILIADLREMAIVKAEVLYVSILTSHYDGHSSRKYAHPRKIHVPNGAAEIVRLYLNTDRSAVISVYGNVRETNIFDQRCLVSLIAHSRLCGV